MTVHTPQMSVPCCTNPAIPALRDDPTSHGTRSLEQARKVRVTLLRHRVAACDFGLIRRLSLVHKAPSDQRFLGVSGVVQGSFLAVNGLTV